MDKIFINDLSVRAIIGVYAWEREVPQKVLINASLSVDTRQAAANDDLTASVDYDQLAKKLQEHAQSSRRLTVEALAADLARLCLETPGVEKVRLRVEKPDALRNARSVGVEIERP